jgi:hypothetical protein
MKMLRGLFPREDNILGATPLRPRPAPEPQLLAGE